MLLPLALSAAWLYGMAEPIRLGAQAYVFAYPLVMMDVTRATAALTIGPENQLRRARQFPDGNFKEVVRPNVDTLYTTAFIDMTQGPWVFTMEGNRQRYELMPFLDGWTNVFATPGTRTNGTEGGQFLLANAVWQGEVPSGMTLIRAPTQIVWLIGRTQTNGVADYPTVHRLQDGLTLRTLADWQAGRQAPEPAWQPSPKKPPPPIQQMRAMSTETFFTRLSMLLVNNPISPHDSAMASKLQRLGITPGKPPTWSWQNRWGISLGRWIAEWQLGQSLKKPHDLVRGWSTPPAILGDYGSDYNTRAAVAMVGLGANLPADATYPNTRVDANGQTLTGSHRYRLHFKAGELPPVKAFWSLTAYGLDNFLIDNPQHRYAIGDRDPLIRNPDGSVDLAVQAEPPEGDRRNNWLPVRIGEPFILNARLYWPQANARDGQWSMPAVERLD